MIEDIIHKEYDVGKKLGQGATGEVYEVIHKVSKCKYALKISREKRIIRKEAEIMKEIPGRVFPKIHTYVEGNNGYLLMECVEGRNLQDMLDAGIRFDLAESVWIVISVLEGLAILHKQTPVLVYRDLKPANIIIENSGKVRLIDLGSVISAQRNETEGMVRAGTYGYAAPEQFWPDMVPMPHWDVYAVGKLLGYLLTGQNPALPPYEVEEYCRKNKKIPNAIKVVINRCLAKQGQARYEDAQSMMSHLQLAYEEAKKGKWRSNRLKTQFEYKKCIWCSEYRRIF